MVVALTGYGIPQTDMALLIENPATGKPIDEKTLRKCFRREIQVGMVHTRTRVIGALFKNAVNNENVTAQIFWLKVRERWKDRPGIDDLLAPPEEPVKTDSDLIEGARRVAFMLALGAAALAGGKR